VQRIATGLRPTTSTITDLARTSVRAMAFSDDELLDFDASRMSGWEGTDAADLLRRHPDLYRNHLTIAKWMDHWNGRMANDPTLDGEFQEGFAAGVRDLAAHLRQGDLLPDGVIYREFVE
jgi:hypothetical protein